MKKIIAIAVALVAFATVAAAQPRAIGARLGGDAEFSYQHSLGANFVEADLGMALGNPGGFCLTGMYDFDFEVGSGFDFYVGPGAQIGFWNGDDDNDAALGIGVGGQLGLGYKFAGAPVQLSIDWRPMWNFLGNHVAWSSAALGVRYAF